MKELYPFAPTLPGAGGYQQPDAAFHAKLFLLPSFIRRSTTETVRRILPESLLCTPTCGV